MKKALPYLVIAAPVAIFALLHFLVVDPERRAAASARSKVAARETEVQAEAAREPQPLVRHASTTAPSDEDFGDVSNAIVALAGSRAVGGVSNLTVEMSAPRTPVSVSFDARYPQIEAFVRNLDTLPVLVDISAIQLVPATAPNMRAKIVFRMFKRTGPPAAIEPLPEPLRPALASRRPERDVPNRASEKPVPEPVVKTILFSPTRRAALVDGRIVGVGDKVGALVVQDIERDAVVFVNPRGVRTTVVLRKSN